MKLCSNSGYVGRESDCGHRTLTAVVKTGALKIILLHSVEGVAMLKIELMCSAYPSSGSLLPNHLVSYRFVL